MSSPVPPEPLDERKRVAEKLRRLPDSVPDYWLFKETQDTAALQRLVLAVVNDFAPRKTGAVVLERTPESRLIEDFGFDSLAVAEVVFFFEDLFAISISNEEIMAVRTLGELNDFVLRKVQPA